MHTLISSLLFVLYINYVASAFALLAKRTDSWKLRDSGLYHAEREEHLAAGFKPERYLAQYMAYCQIGLVLSLLGLGFQLAYAYEGAIEVVAVTKELMILAWILIILSGGRLASCYGLKHADQVLGFNRYLLVLSALLFWPFHFIGKKFASFFSFTLNKRTEKHALPNTDTAELAFTTPGHIDSQLCTHPNDINGNTLLDQILAEPLIVAGDIMSPACTSAYLSLDANPKHIAELVDRHRLLFLPIVEHLDEERLQLAGVVSVQNLLRSLLLEADTTQKVKPKSLGRQDQKSTQQHLADCLQAVELIPSSTPVTALYDMMKTSPYSSLYVADEGGNWVGIIEFDERLDIDSRPT